MGHEHTCAEEVDAAKWARTHLAALERNGRGQTEMAAVCRDVLRLADLVEQAEQTAVTVADEARA